MEHTQKKCHRVPQYKRTQEDEEDDGEDGGSSTQHTAFARIMLNIRSQMHSMSYRANRSFSAHSCINHSVFTMLLLIYLLWLCSKLCSINVCKQISSFINNKITINNKNNPKTQLILKENSTVCLRPHSLSVAELCS